MNGEIFAADCDVSGKPPDPAEFSGKEGKNADGRDEETDEDQAFPERSLHAGHDSPKSDSCEDVLGAAIPRCFQAAGVATLPRGVRFRNPRWMRNGS